MALNRENIDFRTGFRDRSLFLPEGTGSYQENTSQKHMTPLVETKKVMIPPPRRIRHYHDHA